MEIAANYVVMDSQGFWRFDTLEKAQALAAARRLVNPGDDVLLLLATVIEFQPGSNETPGG